MTNVLNGVSTRPKTSTPQNQKAVKGQKRNAAGGYTFVISNVERVKRFLILGSESNFYTSGETLTKENAKNIIKLASDEATSRELVDLIVEISTAGRAPKTNPAIFALAIASSFGTPVSKAYALSNLNAVVRTGTHLFYFVNYVEQFRGWGVGLQKAVANWYTSKPVDKVAYQVTKYRSRNVGVDVNSKSQTITHKDIFRLTHIASSRCDPTGVWNSEGYHGLAGWVTKGEVKDVPDIVKGFTKAQKPGADVAKLVRKYGLSWEMVPTESLNDRKVWEALLDGNVPLGALIRQLPRLTRIGMFAPLSKTTTSVVARITDPEELTRARIHPINLLVAQRTYASGGKYGRASFRQESGSLYQPNQAIVDALDAAFYLAIKTVEPANKRTLIGVDVSGSMQSTFGEMPITSAEVAAAMALVTVSTEPEVAVFGFDTEIRELPISPGQRLSDALAATRSRTFGGTDTSALIRKALKEKIKVDTFIIITDNDTWAGSSHTHQVLEQYRKTMGIPARLVVLSTYASRHTVADPNDDLSLDLAGFDSSSPALIADFSRGL